MTYAKKKKKRKKKKNKEQINELEGWLSKVRMMEIVHVYRMKVSDSLF